MKRFVTALLLGIMLSGASSCKLFLPHHNDDEDNTEHVPIPKDDIKKIVYYHDLATDVVETFMNYYIENTALPACVHEDSLSPWTKRWTFGSSCTLPDGHTYGGETDLIYNPSSQAHMIVLYGEDNQGVPHPTYIDRIPFGKRSLLFLEQQNNAYHATLSMVLPVGNDTLNLGTEFDIRLTDPGQAADGSDKHWQIDRVHFDYVVYHDDITHPLVKYEANESLEPLEKQYNCPLALSGKIRIYDKDLNTFDVDYGNGQCDNTVTVSNAAGDTETLHISTP